MMTFSSRKFLFVIGVAIAVTAAASAFAGGMDYGYADDTAYSGPAYFGFVRDEQGFIVAGAHVLLHPKSGPAITLPVNVLGLYRSHINKDVRPQDVKISCEKEGYRQTRIIPRPGTSDKVVQTDCVMQRI